MSKKYLATIAVVTTLVISAGIVNAYPQNTLFGTGYGFAGYNNFSNGAATSSAINEPVKEYVETTTEATTETIKNTEKNVSNIVRDHDEAPNAGYKTNFKYIEKDMSDYNPNTGVGSNVNDSKSIYTDGLGRLHFFGKGNKFKVIE